MIKFQDKSTIGGARKNSDGFLIAHSKAMRTGIQEYHTSELGMIGDRMIKVYRPESSVRDADSLNSMAHAPITIDHPDEMVTPDNWKDLAVGEVSTAATWDGDFISLPLILKDAAAIKAVEDGKAELSAGYVADMMPVEGEDYDYIMGPPKYNHLAIVDNARAGHKARIGDNWGAAPLNVTDKKEPVMDIVKVMIGDKAVNVAADSADLVMALIADHAKEIETKDAAIGELKAKLADAEGKILSDEDMEAKVKELADAKSRRDTVAAKFGDDAVKDASDAEIAGMFKVIDQAPKVDPVKKVLGDGVKRESDVWLALRKKGEK